MPPQNQTDWFAANAPKAPAADDWFAQNAPTSTSSSDDPTRALSKATAVKAQPKPFSSAWFKEHLWRGASATADTLPAAGATAGAMIGAVPGSGAGPGGTAAGAIGGAGIGGMGGEAARQLLRRMLGYPSPTTSAEAARDITKEGVIQAAVQGVSELFPLAAPGLRSAAATQYERALAPTTKANKVITQDIVPGLLERGEFGSLEGLEKRAGERAAALKPKLDAAYRATSPAKTLQSGTHILQDLENLKGKYTVAGKVANPTAVGAISDVQKIVKQYGMDIPPDSLRKLKGIFDDPVASQGGFTGADLTTKYTLKAQKAAANSIRNIMGKANPDVAALNKEVSFWLDVQRVTSQSGLRRTGQAGGLVKVLSPLAMGSAATITGTQFGAHAGIEAGIATFLTTGAYQVMRSPAWRTASAVTKDRLADALARGSVGDVMALMARFGVAANQEASEAPLSR